MSEDLIKLVKDFYVRSDIVYTMNEQLSKTAMSEDVIKLVKDFYGRSDIVYTMNEQLSKTAMSEDVIKLVKDFYVRSDIVYTMNDQLSKTAMSEDVIKLVKDFYVRSDIVYTMNEQLSKTAMSEDVIKLVKEFYGRSDIVYTMNEQLSKTAMSEDVIKLVKEFYVRSDIVYTMLGMKDEITIWTDSKKQKLRKFYLCMYIKEVYRMFQSAYPDIQIGFSKFASLRPQNVLLLKDQPEDQCKCKMHENFTLKLKALKIEYNDEFWQSYLCDGADLETECWRKECDKCKCGRLFLESMEQQDNREPIVWKKWCKDKSSGETSLASHCCLQLITMTKVKMQS